LRRQSSPEAVVESCSSEGLVEPAVKILYIHQYFVTPEGTSGTRSYDVARYLLELGHEVTMVCGSHHQSGLAPMPAGSLLHRSEVDGIQLVQCAVPYGNSMGVPARMWAFLKFAGLATVACAREPAPDLVFATSTPLTVGIPGRLGSLLKRCSYVFEVRDLWPEDLVDSGNLPKWAAWPWQLLESFSYATAGRIVVVSEGFRKRLIERGFDPQRVQTVVLGADARAYAELQPNREWLARLGLEGKTVAVYAGAHGDENGLFQILDAAELLVHRDDIAFVLLGQGSMKPALEQDVAERALSNVHLLDPVPKKELPGVLAACDIGLMILRPIGRPRWSTPNKLFDYMFAGLPVLVNFSGTTAELVESEGVGVATESGSAAALAKQVEHWADHSEERTATGAAARKVGLAKFTRKEVARELASIFSQVVAGARGA